MAKYFTGAERRLQATFRNIDGDLTDPTTITFDITEPDGTQTQYVFGTNAELQKDSTGIYYVDWPIDQEGRHYWKYTGTGTVAAAEETSFVVATSKL